MARLVRRADGTWAVIDDTQVQSAPKTAALTPEERRKDYLQALRAGLERLVREVGHIPNSWTSMRTPAEKFLKAAPAELDSLVSNDKTVEIFAWKPLPGRRLPCSLAAPQWRRHGLDKLIDQLVELWAAAYD